MNKQSNRYIFIYSSVMVILVAAVLAIASIVLKPFQDKNVEIEKKSNILRSVGLIAPQNVASKDKWTEDAYSKHIVNTFVIDSLGNPKKGIDAFSIDMKAEIAKPGKDRDLPVFEYKDDKGQVLYIIPVRGRGLWGPIWGYVSLESDFNTIAGTTFDHESETPGLGAEINTPAFQAQFKGKKIFEGNTFTSIKVMKGGATPGNMHEVDAISGGTLTSRGLEAMLLDCLRPYEYYFQKNKKK
ncbi:MAG TPA: NADH:ubiquinone reductase (Na(+)-transporting) subunit C [Williamwhitmania sp.]|nr:NADH:ubiquinone reductase (Na(+)-transporting) subunit C [Williamwhitmania sp.]